ncbi:type I-C CRISPR-associated protein Cas8c/Csd1 [Paenibacillus pinistramenti]|uniref:type I-C CRISPR-associated protein Cas8c/Csd1 n=1 Tax=Paenibacillus pinistramenti TaxID=1768003 RepID=UPI0011084810|nr:type I-C CRISPR-associated protein Cas8c/Csd1 [Paenibacillus pinistramenti]
MSWLLNLYKTYESNLDRVGEIEKKYNDQEFTLLPVSHTTQNAHIEVAVTQDGRFHSAKVVDKSDASTLIPCTEKSASRAGKVISPYPLHDKLVYVAGDYSEYAGSSADKESFLAYIKQLEEWAGSPYAVPKVKSIFNYLSQGRLIQDLVDHRILCVDANGRLLDKWDKKDGPSASEKPAIFAVVAGGQESAFVRFNVYSPDEILTAVWKDQEMYDSFIGFYQELLGNEDICYVTGKQLPATDKHANKIRNSADKAKLISANDSSGFTYRGRFTQSNEAASISYEVSQKAHNALKWLINRQGKVIDQRVFLVWGNDALYIPDPTEDSFAINTASPARTVVKSNTNQPFALEVDKALDGYRSDLSSKSDVNIMVLDSATTGRMGVLYYRNMDKDLYLDKLKKWHSTCVWQQRYQRNNQEAVFLWGAPATKDIAFAAYGPRANEKLVKGLMERMLPCIVDDTPIPRDIVTSAIQRASNPVALEKWEWEKTLSITCALINREEGLKLALDTETNDRSYLFGRLLAVADVLERRALGEETRSSNAIRYMNSFSMHPERTWMTIQKSLQPYQARLGSKAVYLSKIIDEIASKFKVEDFNNRPLSGKYLLGFYSQRHELYQKKDSNENTTAEE